MMIGSSPSARRLLRLLSACGIVGAMIGCGRDPYDPGQLVPVVGQVTLEGKPLKMGSEMTGNVSFRPDGSKGNTGLHEPLGAIDAAGNYKLFTAGKEGAPPGWYKVAVAAIDPITDANRFQPRQWFINVKYGMVETSGLALEVVEKPQPGAYDLKLTK